MMAPHAFLASRLRPVQACASGFRNQDFSRGNQVKAIPMHAQEQWVRSGPLMVQKNLDWIQIEP